ncbi:MAG: 2TM domain-containing protein, partial [Saprospiraceae bacterium]
MAVNEYEKARKRVRARKEFYQHLTSYVVMGIFFFLLNAVTSFGAWWFYWPLLGWGIGVLLPYFYVFGFA